MIYEQLNSKTDIPATGTNRNMPSLSLSSYTDGMSGNGNIGSGVTVGPYGFLSFASRATYDNILSIIGKYDDETMDAWERSMGFTSAYATSFVAARGNALDGYALNYLFEDELLLRIIDKNGIIQIGENIFKLEINNYRLLSINVNLFPYFQASFTKGIFEPAGMNQYNTLIDTFDVFDHLATGVVGFNNWGNAMQNDNPTNGSSTGSGGIRGHSDQNGGGGSGNGGIRGHSDQNAGRSGSLRSLSDQNTGYISGGSTKPTPNERHDRNRIFSNMQQYLHDISGDDGFVYRADVKASYQTGLIYYSLMAELKYMRRANGSNKFWANMHTDIWFVMNPGLINPSTGLPDPFFVRFLSHCYYKTRKDDTAAIPTVPNQNFDNRKIDVDNLTWRAYEGSRRLMSFEIDVMFGYVSYATSTPSTAEVQVRLSK